MISLLFVCIRYRREFSQEISCQEIRMRLGKFSLVFLNQSRGQELSFVQETKPLTIYEWHQIVIIELEIGAVGTDFSRRTSWWAREPWKGQNMEINEKRTLV
jgi:hypothetical protein